MKNIPAIIFLAIFVAINSAGCKKKEIPVVETNDVSSITSSSVATGGNVTSDGGDAIISRGVCWSKNSDPTTDDNKTSDGTGQGFFPSLISNLEPGTVYYIKAYAINGTGTGYGEASNFKTLGEVPSASATMPSGVTTTTARLTASINANYVSTKVTFEYGTTTEYGNSVVPSQSPLSGYGNVTVTVDLSALIPGTIYHYRVKAENSLGTTYSNDLTFRTLGQAPSITNLSSSSLTTTSVTLSAYVNPNYVPATVTCEYGISTSYGNSISVVQNPLTGNANILVSAMISSLSPGTLYHIRLKAENSVGITYSADITITTLGQGPAVTTRNATNISVADARLEGTINPKYLATTGTFEYGKTTSYGNSVSVLPNPGSGNSDVFVYAIVSGLEPGTVYHFRLKAVNSLGTNYGSDLTFRTSGQLPTSITRPATQLMTNSTFLNGSVNANYLSTAVTFEYGTSNTLGSFVNADQNPVTGTTLLPVTARLSGLTEGQTYYFRTRAENALGVAYGDILTFVPAAPPVSVLDVDGNIYPVIQIGTQYWMAENLKTTKYNDNTSIPNVTNGSTWITLTSPGYCWYNNDETSYKNTYGALYNFYAVSTGKLCPSGWHVPSNAEFTVFTNALGDINYAGGKIKEAGTVHWTSPNTGATNETGFTALPAGYVTDAGTFDGIGRYEAWWTSTPYNEIKPWYRSVGYQTAAVEERNGSLNQRGFSVRCIKD